MYGYVISTDACKNTRRLSIRQLLHTPTVAPPTAFLRAVSSFPISLSLHTTTTPAIFSSTAPSVFLPPTQPPAILSSSGDTTPPRPPSATATSTSCRVTFDLDDRSWYNLIYSTRPFRRLLRSEPAAKLLRRVKRSLALPRLLRHPTWRSRDHASLTAPGCSPLVN